MALDQAATARASVNRAVEVSIHVGLLILLVTACLFILYPFIPLVAWGIIIAVAAYPGFQKLQRWLGDRATLAAVVFTLVLLALVIVPAILLGQSLVEGAQAATAKFKAGAAIIPPPPASIETWPIIGPPLKGLWTLASKDLSEAIRKFGPQIKAALPGVLSASAGFGLTVLQLLLSIIVSGALLANAKGAYEVTRSLANRLFGQKGPEFQQLVGKTIRSITFGILGSRPHSVCVRGARLLRGRTACGEPVVSDFRVCCGATGGRTDTHSGGDLHVCRRQHYQGRDLPDLVHCCRIARQHTEAFATGAGSCCSNGGHFSRRVRRILRYGYHRPLHRRGGLVRRLQAVPRLAGRGRSRSERGTGFLIFERATKSATSRVQATVSGPDDRISKRVASIDWMRGVVMVFMGLDHASMAFDAQHLDKDSAVYADAQHHGSSRGRVLHALAHTPVRTGVCVPDGNCSGLKR